MELPAGAFPDGDPDAEVAELADGGHFARFLRGVVFVVVGMVVLGYVLGQVRSEGLAYVYVPALFAGIVYLGRLAAPFMARQRAHSMDAWQRRTGMQWIDPVPVTEHPARVFKPVGITPSLHGLVLEGRPFEGAPPSSRLADAMFGTGRDAEYVTLLALPLPAHAASQLGQVALTFGTRIGDVLDPVERGFLRWPIVSFERSDRVSRVRVRAPEGADALPIWDVFDPSLLVRLEQAAANADDAGIGMVVRDGWLVSWCEGNLVERGAAEYVATAIPAADTVMAPLPAWFELTRLVHARLAG